MFQGSKYLAFGLLVLASYWFTVSRGVVYFDGSETPQGRGTRSHPTFWGGGFQGGK